MKTKFSRLFIRFIMNFVSAFLIECEWTRWGTIQREKAWKENIRNKRTERERGGWIQSSDDDTRPTDLTWLGPNNLRRDHK
jgi:hypothetical protein